MCYMYADDVYLVLDKPKPPTEDEIMTYVQSIMNFITSQCMDQIALAEACDYREPGTGYGVFSWITPTDMPKSPPFRIGIIRSLGYVLNGLGWKLKVIDPPFENYSKLMFSITDKRIKDID